MTAPRILDSLPAEQYHATKALGSSGIWTLHTECPALFWHNSAWNPGFVREQKRHFDIGNAGHLMALEPEHFDARVVLIDADDYRTKEAREARDRAYLANRTPLLLRELDTLHAMRKALFAHPIAKHAFVGGKAEQSYFWTDAATGAPCKARPDYLPNHRRYLPDYKTSTSANPEAFARRIADLGYHVRAAWYIEGIRAVEGEAPDRAAFIVQAKEPPFLVSVCWLDDEALAWGKIICRRAVETFARCLARNDWPGYRDALAPDADGAFTVKLPQWTRRRLEDKHAAGEFESKYEKLVAAGGNPLT